MNRPLIISFALHAGLAVFVTFGVTPPKPAALSEETVILIEAVEIADETAAPPIPAPTPKPEPPKPETKSEPKPPPPPQAPPKPQQAALPPPAPEPESEPESEPEPAPEPEAEAEPEPEPEPEPQIAKALEKTPPKKPKQPEAPELTSVLKDLLANMETPAAREPEKKETFSADIAKMLEKQPQKQRPLVKNTSDVATISEIDAVRRQIYDCWNVPAGARGAENLVIEIKTTMRSDGMVESANIADSARVRKDTFYRTAAESALRAVLNPSCQPFKLPPEKYASWRKITFAFDPKEMFGQ